jgi:hypothetical protein
MPRGRPRKNLYEEPKERIIRIGDEDEIDFMEDLDSYIIKAQEEEPEEEYEPDVELEEA